MRKNVASQKIGAGMASATDGSAFTSTVTVYITGDAGTQAIGSVGSGVCTHEGNGYHTYAPAQAETNYDLIAFTFIGTGAIPCTIQVETRVDANVTHWLATAAATPATAGIPDVNVKNIDNDAASASGTVTFPAATLASTTNITAGTITTATTVTNQLTAAQIATGVWQDATAGDFTTASSIGKALYVANVAPGAAGGHFIAGTNAATTITTGLTTTFTGNLTGSVGSVTGQLTAAAIATGVWQDATAGDFTTASSIGKALYVSNVVPGAAGGHFIAGANAGTTVNIAGTISSVVGAVGSVASAVTVGTNNDKTGYTLSAAGIDAIMNDSLANNTTAGTLGKLVSDINIATAATVVDVGNVYSEVTAITGVLSDVGVTVEGHTNQLTTIGDGVADNTNRLDGVASLIGTPAVSLAADIATRLATSGYTVPPTAATNATAVRTNLATELARLDVAVGSRSQYQDIYNLMHVVLDVPVATIALNLDAKVSEAGGGGSSFPLTGTSLDNFNAFFANNSLDKSIEDLTTPTTHIINLTVDD